MRDIKYHILCMSLLQEYDEKYERPNFGVHLRRTFQRYLADILLKDKYSLKINSTELDVDGDHWQFIIRVSNS